MHFSNRTGFGHESDPLTSAAAARRAEGLPVLDLTESNPTRCGLALPAEVLLPPLAAAANLHYRAEPFGPVEARRSIAEQYYAARAVTVDADSMLLTASTSEAYSFLFRLFCEPGDAALVPQPSYPLFDLLARLCDVELQPYALRWHDRWEIDFEALEQAITPRTRAIVVVHPNNPTGHGVSADERARLDAFAARHHLPLLVDEVFLDYTVESPAALTSFAAGPQPQALTFIMSGLSKVLALPQMKLAWTMVRGPEDVRREALHRLEFLADTYLSVAAPAAQALPSWLRRAAVLQHAVRLRVRSNLAVLDDLLRDQSLVSRVSVEGGWSVLLRVPALETAAECSLRLLESEGVLVYPGSFFGMGPKGWLILSLLPHVELFKEACRRLLAFILRCTHEAES